VFKQSNINNMPSLVIFLPDKSFIKGKPCFLEKSALSGSCAPLILDNVFPGSFITVKDALKMEIARVVIVDSTVCITVNWFHPVDQSFVAGY
jgi:hypothetical protein